MGQLIMSDKDFALFCTGEDCNFKCEKGWPKFNIWIQETTPRNRWIHIVQTVGTLAELSLALNLLSYGRVAK